MEKNLARKKGPVPRTCRQQGWMVCKQGPYQFSRPPTVAAGVPSGIDNDNWVGPQGAGTAGSRQHVPAVEEYTLTP